MINTGCSFNIFKNQWLSYFYSPIETSFERQIFREKALNIENYVLFTKANLVTTLE